LGTVDDASYEFNVIYHTNLLKFHLPLYSLFWSCFQAKAGNSLKVLVLRNSR